MLSFKRGDVINLLDCAQFEARKADMRMGGGEGVFQGYVDGQVGFVASQVRSDQDLLSYFKCIDYFRPIQRGELDRYEYASLLKVRTRFPWPISNLNDQLLVSPDLALATALFTVAERSQFEYISKSIMHVYKGKEISDAD